MGVFNHSFDRQASFPLSMKDRLGLLIRIYNAEALRLRYNTDLVARAFAAKDNFKQASEQFKNDKITKEDLNKISTEAEKLAHEVLAVSQIIRLGPDSTESLRCHLLQAENVHPIVQKGKAIEPQHLQELNDNRLGMMGMNKDCQALVIDTEQGPRILAQIFRYHAHIPMEDGGLKYKNLPGFVDEIKSSPVAGLTGEENFVGYWTISSTLLDSGPALVRKLAEVLPENAIEATISPVRSFTLVETDPQAPDYLEANSDFRDSITRFANDDDIREAVLKHLIEGKDSVRDFHLGNGAYIGWIHINRDAPIGSPDWITVNYIYDRNRLADHQFQFEQGRLPISPALQQFVGDERLSYIHNISETEFIVKTKPAQLVFSPQ